MEPISEYGDEPDPIVIDIDDDEPVTSPAIHFNRYPPFHQFPGTTRPPTATVNPLPNPAARLNQKTGANKKANKKSSSQSIVVVDLCSSDEEAEEDENMSVPMDENHDPLLKSASTTNMCVDPSYFSSTCISPNKVYAKPCVYPNIAAGDWHSNYYNVSEPRKTNFFKQMSLYKTSGQ